MGSRLSPCTRSSAGTPMRSTIVGTTSMWLATVAIFWPRPSPWSRTTQGHVGQLGVLPVGVPHAAVLEEAFAVVGE